MEVITGKHVSRRRFLRGMSATISLPLLDAMVPVRLLNRGKVEDPTRLVCIEMVHGAAGSNELGADLNLWSPAQIGRDFDLTGSSLSPLEEFRDYLTIVSNTDVRMAEAFDPREIGGDHFRSSAVFLTQAHPHQTEGSDIFVGESLDQMYAKAFGQDTPIPSMQLCIENVDQAGGCAYGYACVYTDTISWKSPTEPLPMIRDPRVAFDQMFGGGGTVEQRRIRRETERSILDWIVGEMKDLKRELGVPDQRRVDQYLENIREIERRIQKVEVFNQSGEDREIPEATAGVPDSFREHIEIMFDLQALAFASRFGLTQLLENPPYGHATGVVSLSGRPAKPPPVRSAFTALRSSLRRYEAFARPVNRFRSRARPRRLRRASAGPSRRRRHPAGGVPVAAGRRACARPRPRQSLRG